MSLPLIRLLLLLIAGLVARSVHAAAGGETIESVPGGAIDWKRGCITATGHRTPLDKETDGELGRQVLLTAARVAAQENLLQAAKRVRIDRRARVNDAVIVDPELLNRLVDLVVAAPVTHQESLPDGSATVTVELPMQGGFAALMLPEEIRSYRMLQAQVGAGREANTGEAGHPPPGGSGPPPFSGLLLDVTRIKVNPAMVVRVFDERGREVYGPAFVDREQAVQSGVCGYDHSPPSPAALPRIGSNPMIVKGLRSEGEGASDLVISNADATLLRSAPQHLAFLRRCAVVILLR